MTAELLLILASMMTCHWYADFHLQNDWMAQGKSSSNYILFLHVATYTLFMLLFSVGMVSNGYFHPSVGFIFPAVNGILHFCVDWVTSRWTSYHWKRGERHEFFVVIGFDQLLHFICLASTLAYFMRSHV
jgi:hypothetical protein